MPDVQTVGAASAFLIGASLFATCVLRAAFMAPFRGMK